MSWSFDELGLRTRAANAWILAEKCALIQAPLKTLLKDFKSLKFLIVRVTSRLSKLYHKVDLSRPLRNSPNRLSNRPDPECGMGGALLESRHLSGGRRNSASAARGCPR